MVELRRHPAIPLAVTQLHAVGKGSIGRRSGDGDPRQEQGIHALAYRAADVHDGRNVTGGPHSLDRVAREVPRLAVREAEVPARRPEPLLSVRLRRGWNVRR